MSDVEPQDKGWCVLELMGHRKLAGYITDDAGLLRIDVYAEVDAEVDAAAPIATQWYGASSIYCITASTRDVCVALTRTHQPAPVGRWELPPPQRLDDDAIADADLDDEQGY